MPEQLRPDRQAGPVLLVVAAAVSQELGAALAVTLFSTFGALGMVFVRLGVAGLVLCAVMRPRLRGLGRAGWSAACALAAALTVMNTFFYFALTHIPLGVAVTIEVLGPLILSVVVSSRRVAWLWATLAFAGVALLGLTQQHLGGIDVKGVGFAIGAGVAWAAYILASAQAGAELPRLDGLAIASAIGAIVLAPFAVMSLDTSAALHWHVIGLGLAVGLMSSVIPYSLELWSLRRLSAGTFAILTSISPVTASIAGWLVLGQQLGALGYLAIALVSVACVGAVRSAHGGLGPAPSGQ
ncbi:EamA family transporter [soil metagenome]